MKKLFFVVLKAMLVLLLSCLGLELSSAALMYFHPRHPGRKETVGYSEVHFGRIPGVPFEIPVESGRWRKKTVDGTVLWDLPFTIERPFARRWVPQDTSRKADAYVIFMGCSFAMGQGVADDQTLEAYLAGFLAKSLHGVRVYDYGMSGASPGDVLMRMRPLRARSAEIPEPTGTVIYEFIDDHLARTVGDLQRIGYWDALTRIYEKGANGDFELRGEFSRLHPWVTFFYRVLAHTWTFRYFQIDYPPIDREPVLEKVADMISEMNVRARRDLNAKNFFVFFYPGSDFAGKLIPLLEKRHVRSLDFSKLDLGAILSGKDHLEYDQHPSPEANRFLASRLARIYGSTLSNAASPRDFSALR